MKNYRFYAELSAPRGSKSGSKRYEPFTRALLKRAAQEGRYCNVIAVYLDEVRLPLYNSSGNIDAAVPACGASNSTVHTGSVSTGYLRKRCVRVSAGTARSLHPELFRYLERSC